MIHETAIVEGENEIGDEVLIGPYSTINNVKIGNNSKLFKYVNAYGCEIGSDCKIGAFTEIQGGAKIGNQVTVSTHSFICDMVTVADRAWIGHNVMTINDLNPPSRKRTGTTDEWKPTYIGEGAVIGSNATLFPVNIGKYATIGAGAVVIKDVPDYAVVVGNPGRVLKIKKPEENDTPK